MIQAIFVALWPKIDRGGVFAHPAAMFVLICLLFYMLQATIGAGCIMFMRRRILISLRSYVFAGLIAMALPVTFVVLLAASRGQLSPYATIYNVAFFTLGGALAGLVFWTVAVRSRD